jgi:hypothetical protein
MLRNFWQFILAYVILGRPKYALCGHIDMIETSGIVWYGVLCIAGFLFFLLHLEFWSV